MYFCHHPIHLQYGEHKKRHASLFNKNNNNTNLKENHEDEDYIQFFIAGSVGMGNTVLREVLGLSEDKMLVPVDIRRGEMLLHEILAGGNFGRYDSRNGLGDGFIGHNLQRLCRDLRFLRYYPAEALSEPLFRIWHYGWRHFLPKRTLEIRNEKLEMNMKK